VVAGWAIGEQKVGRGNLSNVTFSLNTPPQTSLAATEEEPRAAKRRLVCWTYASELKDITCHSTNISFLRSRCQFGREYLAWTTCDERGASTKMPGLSTNRWALLIGVGFYMTGNARKDSSGCVIHYPSLGGCVNDVALLECFLEDEVRVPAAHIFKLTSSAPRDPTKNEPQEARALWPTYNNISRAFQNILQNSERGDLVYIHYSGHGARVRTAYEYLKRPEGIDEALVPVDIEVISGTDQGRYIRDIEIATWLQQFVDKGLRVTVVLDSCHAGSSNRAGYAAVRGTGIVDRSFLPSDGSSALECQSLHDCSGVWRHGRVQENWLLEASGYTLFAACTAFQKAHEYRFANKMHGALSYYLVDALRSELGPTRPSLLLSRISTKVRSHFSEQTPILDGDDSVAFFGLDGSQLTQEVRVSVVDVTKGCVELDHGDLHGVHKGDEYAVISDGGLASGGDVVRIRVTDTLGLKSIAVFLDISESEQRAIQPGFRASMLKQAPERLAGVRLVSRDTAPTANEQPGWLKDLHNCINNERRPASLWRLLADDDKSEPATFSITVTDQGEYEVRDASQTPVTNLPPLRADDPKSAKTLSEYISHLAKFRRVQRLGANPSRALKASCRFELQGKLTEPPLQPPLPNLSCESVSPVVLQPAVLENGEYKINAGEIVSIVFENKGKSPVHVAVFDLKPLWGIEKIYPEGAGWSESVGPGEQCNLLVQMDIPDSLLKKGQLEITETIKAVATLHPTPLGVLQLPDIGEDSLRGGHSANFVIGLDQLMQGPSPDNRNAKLKVQSGGSWQAYDIIIRTTQSKEKGDSRSAEMKSSC
jgi:hypothetical protein